MRDLKFKKEFSTRPQNYDDLHKHWQLEDDYSVQIVNDVIVILSYDDHVSISKNDFKKIEDLLKGKTDESHRLPYKKI